MHAFFTLFQAGISSYEGDKETDVGKAKAETFHSSLVKNFTRVYLLH